MKAFEEQSNILSVNNTVDMVPKKGDHSTRNTVEKHFDNNQDLSVIDDRHLENHKIKDQHLGYDKIAFKS